MTRTAFLFSFLFFFQGLFAQDGRFDTSFANGGKLISNFGFPPFYVEALCIQRDGKVVVGGGAMVTGTQREHQFFLTRFKADGQPDSSFGIHGIVYTPLQRTESMDRVTKIIQLPDGRLLVGGTSSEYSSDNLAICRYMIDGRPDSSFNGTGIHFTSGGLGDFEWQPDGKLLVTTEHSGRVFRLLPDGTLDRSFNHYQKTAYELMPRLVHRLADDKVVVAGYNRTWPFVSDGPYVMRLKSNGVLDSTFGKDGYLANEGFSVHHNVLFSVDQQERLYECIWYSPSNRDTFQVRISRLLPSGQLDLSFGNNGTVKLEVPDIRFFTEDLVSFQLQPDGKIIFGGTLINTQGVRQLGVLRLLPNGDFDPGFGQSGQAFIETGTHAFEGLVASQGQDGSVVVAGYDFANGRYGVAAGRLLPDGSADRSFGTGGVTSRYVGIEQPVDDVALDILSQEDGKFITAGSISNGPYSSVAVVRYEPGGNIDSSFGEQGVVYLTTRGRYPHNPDLLQQRDGQYALNIKQDKAGNLVILSWEKDLVSLGRQCVLYKLKKNGQLDPAFGAGGRQVIRRADSLQISPYGLGLQSDGKIIVAASAYNRLTYIKDGPLVGRILPDGRIDSSFGKGGWIEERRFQINPTEEEITTNRICLQADDKILFTGDNTPYYLPFFGVARYTRNGLPDSTFGYAGLTSTKIIAVNQSASIAVQPDGKIVLAGAAHSTGKCVARFDSTGKLDYSFGKNGVKANIGIGFNSDVVLQADGKIILHGTSISTNDWEDGSQISISRLLENGSEDITFGNGGTLTFSNLDKRRDLPGLMTLAPTGEILLCGGTNLRMSENYGSANSFVYRLTNRIQDCSRFTIAQGRDTMICSGGQGVVIGAAPVAGISYSWRPDYFLNNANQAQPTVNPNDQTYYTLTATNPGGCIAYDTVIVSVAPALSEPFVTVSAGQSNFCEGGSVRLITSATGSFQWYRDNVLVAGATSKEFTTTLPGHYQVEVRSIAGCIARSVQGQLVTVYPQPPKPVIVQTGNTLSTGSALSYQWYLNGQLIAGANYASYTAATPGNYAVMVTSPFQCPSVLSEPVAVISTGINDPALNGNISVGPNPVTDALHIRYSGNFTRLWVSITDASGRTVLSGTSFTTTFDYDASTLKPGVYIVLIRDLKAGHMIRRTILKV
ncbi:T9SS type A sorting domain-containing protein [Paraflavitalea pollutisoli]|uniref:T9SS type A sorting domain-containing protein n=1 Tax=Paraflavitalea pollutisoli TaxID=3034143 RepID=UPI0023EC548E|nr:T9SS type A sorting domain-containing protein [Paraflavitalea sp. H1-2-19X]